MARLLPLTADEILSFAAKTIENRLGTWVTGMPGALAEFTAPDNQEIAISLEDGQLVGRTPTAAFRLRAHDKLRAFAFGESGPIVLGMPKARVTLNAATSFTALGSDHHAILAENRDHALFDYGLGRKYSRFGIRTASDGLIASLLPFEGKPWPELMAAIGGQIISESPNRIVETALARIEVSAPIPPPHGASPEGSHTHFLPAYLASGEEIQPRLALPDYAAPIAIYYPR
jgi:hypothetical protein